MPDSGRYTKFQAPSTVPIKSSGLGAQLLNVHLDNLKIDRTPIFSISPPDGNIAQPPLPSQTFKVAQKQTQPKSKFTLAGLFAAARGK